MSENEKSRSRINHLLLPPALDEAGEHATEASGDSPSIPTGDARNVETLYTQPSNDVASSSLPEIEGYRIERKLGQGGMGAVYLAVDEKLDRQVAVKVVTQHVSRSPKLTERFVSEIKSVAALNHPNIAQLYEAQMFAEPPFFVMEYVDGPTLEEFLQNQPQTPVAAAQIILAIANAIEFCHAKNIIHRDLKPSNILLDASMTPKVADFGLAKSLQDDSDSTKTGEIVGTPGYMAPEQASGVVKSIGPACDVYGLGAVLYRMLTGRPPFYSSEPVQTVMMVLSDDPIAPRKLQKNIPRDLETICLKCLAKKPERRYASMQHLAADLQHFIDGKPIEARPISTTERTLKWMRRRPAIASILILLALAIPAIIAGLWYHTTQLDLALQEKGEALDKSDRALKKADAELRRSTKLASEGSAFTEWIYLEHIGELQRLNGSIKAQMRLAERIQKYLDAATPHMPQDIVYLRRHARAYIAIADIQGNPDQANMGKLKTALKNYDLGLKLYEDALKMEPDDRVTRKILANAVAKKMELVIVLSGPKAAKELMKKYDELLKSIENENEAEFRLVRIRFLQHQFAFAMLDDNFKAAMQFLDNIDSEYRPIKDPSQRVTLETEHLKIWTHLKRGEVYERMSQFKKSEQHTKLAIAEARRTHEVNRDDPKFAERYASTLMVLADLQFQQRRAEDALNNFKVIESLRRTIWQRNADNANAAGNLATVLTRISTVYGFMNRPDDSIDFAKKGIALRRELYQKQPESEEYARNLWLAITSLASAQAGKGDLKQAEKGFREQESLMKKHIDLEKPSRVDLATYAQCKFNLGLVEFSRFGEVTLSEESWKGISSCTELDEYKSAIKYFDAGLELYQRLEKLGPLNRNDKNYQKIIENTKAALIENSKKLDKLMKKSKQQNDII